MVNMKPVACCRAVVALLCGAGGLVAQVSTPGTASHVRSLVSRYVAALQRRDYSKIVELNDGLRSGEAIIRHDRSFGLS
jgi:hypothetical protein